MTSPPTATAETGMGGTTSPQQMSQREARDLTSCIKATISIAWELIAKAYSERAWSALGYPSWDEYCASEFDTCRLRLPREERAVAVSSLRDSGLSLRAIQSATGISRPTIIKDLKSRVVNSLPAGHPRLEEIDGFVSAGLINDVQDLAEILAMADVTDEEFEQVLAEGRAQGDLSRGNVVKLCDQRSRNSKPVNGLDGKTYAPRAKKRVAKQKPTPPATFARLMRTLTELNILAEECLTVADELKFDHVGKWQGLSYDYSEQYASACALSGNLAQLVAGIVGATTRKNDDGGAPKNAALDRTAVVALPHRGRTQTVSPNGFDTTTPAPVAEAVQV